MAPTPPRDNRANKSASPSARSQRTPTVAEVDMGLGETEPFQAIHRPSLAFLCLLDNGPNDGEWVRLREERIVIGRSEGDIRIPHDSLISTKHAELTRQFYKGAHTWVLTDLQSANGSYARISKAPLDPGQEIWIGGGRYRFDSPLDRAEAAPPTRTGEEEDEHISTYRWTGKSTGRLAPYLAELSESGEGKHFDLLPSENWIGRDPSKCSIAIADPMMDHQHCRIHREPTGRWYIQDNRTLNGSWVRVEQFRIKQAAQFQLGEQRFLLRVGSVAAKENG